GRSRELRATLDYWDDPLDVYAVKLTAGTTFAARVQGSAEANVNLDLWRPGTLTVLSPARILTDRVARAARPGAVERIVYTARRDEHVLLERRVGGHVRVRLDLRERADRRVVLDQRPAPDHDVVAYLAALSDTGLVADDHARADPSASEDDGAGRDDRARPEL